MNEDKKEITASRRQHPRFNVDITVAVTVAEAQISAHTRDISRSGVCLVSLSPIARDTEIALELVLTFGEGGISEPLNLRGKVVWCTALFGAFQIGVKFANVDDEQARYLNMFIGFLDGSISAGDLFFDDEPTTSTRMPDPDDPFRG
jgi:hypothetical protein